jgi:anti-sigma regulatory factor (Ser/Thr protein kinase)
MQTDAAKALETTAFRRSYPGTVFYVRCVRADLAPFAAGYPRAADLILLASELSANAAQYSDSRKPGGEFTVRARLCTGDRARLEVEDQGGRWITREPGDERPHGLDIVAMLAGEANWGVRQTGSGTRVVWVRLGWTEPA